MSILRDFEKRLEGAVEGFFARAFRSGLQPVELAKAVQRYAANYQQVGLEGTFVPNVYRFSLSPEDMQRFSGFVDSMKRELAEVVVRTTADRSWRLRGGVVIQIVESDEIRTGTYELRGKVQAPTGQRSQPSAPQRQAAGGGGSTQVLPRAATQAGLVTADGRRHTLDGPALIGRLPECDVTIDDPAVSRRHARLTYSDGGYSVEDLGSTNGVQVNGESVQRAALRDGDRLDLGGVMLTFTSGP